MVKTLYTFFNKSSSMFFINIHSNLNIFLWNPGPVPGPGTGSKSGSRSRSRVLEHSKIHSRSITKRRRIFFNRIELQMVSYDRSFNYKPKYTKNLCIWIFFWISGPKSIWWDVLTSERPTKSLFWCGSHNFYSNCTKSFLNSIL